MFTAVDKWTAFLLSAIVPGAGQLAARSWTCLAWFAAAAGLVVAGTALIPAGAGEVIWPLLAVQFAAGITLCLLSAEHAKRLLETRRTSLGSVIESSVRCSGGRGRNVDVLISLTVRQSPEGLWRLISDLPRFLTIDPFHDAVTLMRENPAKGVDVVLSHNAFGRRFLRFGRIIAWQEGTGYTFSDLSARGPRMGFPHVFIVRIEPVERPRSQAPLGNARPEAPLHGLGSRASTLAFPSGAWEQVESPLPHGRGSDGLTQLTIRVRGRWTSRIVPVALGRLWIHLVCREHARLLFKAL